MDSDKNQWLIILAIIGFLLLMLLTASCARIEATPPEVQLLPAPSRTVPVDYDTALARSIGWFDAHEAEITEIDRKLSYVEGRLGMGGDDTRLDCGTFQVSTALSRPSLLKVAKVRIYLRNVFGSYTETRVTVTGNYKMTVVDNYAARLVSRSGPCVSRGGLEREIFAFLSGPI